MAATTPVVSKPPTPSSLDKTLRIARTAEYPHQVWFFLAALLALVAFFQYTSLLIAKLTTARRIRRRSPSPDTESPVRNTSSLSWRRLPSALSNTFRIIAFRYTINIGQSYSISLAEVALSCMYIIALFTWDFINTTDTSGDKLSMQYWSNRTGALALSQFPFVTVLGTKNNVISAIILVSYDKLNYLHRTAARVVFILVWVHAGSKIASGLGTSIDETFVRMGLVAATSFAVLILVSIRPIRARQYEFFFYTHFILVLVILLSVYYHSLEFKLDKYVWPSFLIWGLDRLIRGLRILIFNFLGFRSNTLDAKAELVSDQFVRITLKRPPHFHWSPGQTAYLITPGVSSLPFEAHPFTIASYDSSNDGSDVKDVDSEASQEKLDDEGKRYWKELFFLVNVRTGFTYRLAEAATKNERIKAILDGPYGPSPDLSHFDTSVFIAGGSGVSYTLPLFLQTVARVKQGISNCTRVVFIWAIRDSNHIRWISDALYQAVMLAPGGLDIDIRIFITGRSAPESPTLDDVVQWDTRSLRSESVASDEKGQKVSKTTFPPLPSLPTVNTISGRPDLSKLLKEESELMNDSCMSVDVCGSTSVARSVRSALGFDVCGPSKTLYGAPSITLHVESFGYA